MYTGLTAATSGEQSASYSRRIVNTAGRTMKTLSGLNNAMSYRKRSWKRNVLSNSADRNPSCIRISMTANEMPATATSSRNGRCASCIQPSGSGSCQRLRVGSAANLDFHLQVREVGRSATVVQLDLDLDDTCVLAR